LITRGQGPLTLSAALLLALAIGVIFVSAKKFVEGHRAPQVPAEVFPT
jgi:hypothetical protein